MVNYKQDRTYWRDQVARRLIDAGKDSGDELSVALAERLEDLIHDGPRQAVIDVMRAEIEALERQVNDLLENGN